MCDASMIGAASMATQGIGVISSAYGAYSKASGEQAGYQYQANVADNNKQIAGWQAADALQRGQTAVARHGTKVAQLRGAQRATLAARGVDLGEGSALDILSDTEFMGGVDANTIKDNAAKEAWGYRVQAVNASSNADLLRMRASNIDPGGDAMSTFLTGAGGVAKTWYSLKEKGVF